MNIDTSFSTESFIEYLKTLDSKKQKRMLFMIEAGLTIFDDYDYYTDFGTYPNYQHFGLDKFLGTDFFMNYHKFRFSISDDVFNKPDDSVRDRWKTLKNKLLNELNFDHSIFDYQYEMFKFGLKLKELRQRRNISKSEFSIISGLSKQKITKIEDSGFLSKISEVNQYVVGGLKMSLNLNIK